MGKTGRRKDSATTATAPEEALAGRPSRVRLGRVLYTPHDSRHLQSSQSPRRYLRRSVSGSVHSHLADSPNHVSRVRERLKDVLRQYELRERHFECVIRSKELEVLLSRARAAEQKQLAEGEKARGDKAEAEVSYLCRRSISVYDGISQAQQYRQQYETVQTGQTALIDKLIACCKEVRAFGSFTFQRGSNLNVVVSQMPNEHNGYLHLLGKSWKGGVRCLSVVQIQVWVDDTNIIHVRTRLALCILLLSASSQVTLLVPLRRNCPDANYDSVIQRPELLWYSPVCSPVQMSRWLDVHMKCFFTTKRQTLPVTLPVPSE